MIDTDNVFHDRDELPEYGNGIEHEDFAESLPEKYGSDGKGGFDLDLKS